MQPVSPGTRGGENGEILIKGCKLPDRRWINSQDLTIVRAYLTSLVAQTAKNSPARQETWGLSLVSKIPWRREHLPTPVFLPGEFHGQRGLEGYSPWGRKELDMTDQLSTHTHTTIGNLSNKKGTKSGWNAATGIPQKEDIQGIAWMPSG